MDTSEGRVTQCPDPLEALGLLDGLFASDSSEANPQHVVLLRDLQLHLDQSDPMRARTLKRNGPVEVVEAQAGLKDIFDLVRIDLEGLGIRVRKDRQGAGWR